MGNGRTGKGNATTGSRSDVDKLRLGESIWIRGCLVVATDGLLTLESRGKRMIVRADDVRSKEELEGQTLLEVSPDANIILRTENVVRAGSGQCDCRGPAEHEPGSATGTAALRINDDTFPDPFLPHYRCRVEYEQVLVCHTVEIHCQLRRVCYPELRQVVVCWHEGSGGIA